MNTLLTTQQEQDLKFDEAFYMPFTNDILTEGRREKIKAFMHSRDLAIENAVRTELVEEIRGMKKYPRESTGTQANIKIRQMEVGWNASLETIIELLTTSPSR